MKNSPEKGEFLILPFGITFFPDLWMVSNSLVLIVYSRLSIYQIPQIPQMKESFTLQNEVNCS